MVRNKSPKILRLFERQFQKSPFSLFIGSCLFVLLLVAMLIYVQKEKRPELEVRTPISNEEVNATAFEYHFQNIELPLKTSEGHTVYGLGPIDRVAVSNDGTRVVSMSEFGLFVWDLEKSRETPILHLPNFYKHEPVIAFSPNDNNFALGSQTGEVYLWNAETWEPHHKFTADHLHPIRTLVFAPDGKSLLTGTHVGIAKRWDYEKVELLETYDFQKPIEKLTFSPDGVMILGMLDRHPAKLLTLKRGKRQLH